MNCQFRAELLGIGIKDSLEGFSERQWRISISWRGRFFIGTQGSL